MTMNACVAPEGWKRDSCKHGLPKIATGFYIQSSIHVGNLRVNHVGIDEPFALSVPARKVASSNIDTN